MASSEDYVIIMLIKICDDHDNKNFLRNCTIFLWLGKAFNGLLGRHRYVVLMRFSIRFMIFFLCSAFYYVNDKVSRFSSSHMFFASLFLNVLRRRRAGIDTYILFYIIPSRNIQPLDCYLFQFVFEPDAILDGATFVNKTSIRTSRYPP